MSTRQERDALGVVEIAAGRYWGAQTQRAIAHFAIGTERFPLPIIRALGHIKRACAEVNQDLGRLDEERGRAIAQAAQEVVEGLWDDHFPLHLWQSGSGTQTNMNANEVIGNRATELCGHSLGSKFVHPNDHVNRSQSSNDVIPSAMHVAVVEELAKHLLPSLRALRDTLRSKAQDFADVIKVGRTHLQDATPLTLGQEISGMAAQLDAALGALEQAKQGCLPVALGGTAVGTGLHAHPEYASRVASRLAELTGHAFVTAPNKFAALAGHEPLVLVSGACRALATALMKIANDVRWLSSGPRCGIGEIAIPENEPGSSIMPGKVNPTQAEALVMVCIQVMGNDVAVGLGGASGSFELNVCKPVIAHNVLQSIRLLGDASTSFDRHCAVGVTPRHARITALMEQSLMLVTALTPHIGYDAAARIAHHAHAHEKTLRQSAEELGVLDPEAFDRLVRPQDMVAPK